MTRPLRLLVVVGLLALSACGASQRSRALRVGLTSLNVARDTMLAVSKERERQIVEHAATKEQGRTELDAWRTKVDKVALALEVGYRAIYAASILNDAKSASDAVTAVAIAVAAITALKPSPPPDTPPAEVKP